MLLAPSGLGKTIGTLFPALKYALKKNKRVFVITSKTTQQHIYRETLRIFTKKKAKFNSIILTAKEKMCVNSAFICEKSLCPYLDNYGKISLNKIVSEMLKKQVIDARYIRKMARNHTVCPFKISLDPLISANCVVDRIIECISDFPCFVHYIGKIIPVMKHLRGMCICAPFIFKLRRKSCCGEIAVAKNTSELSPVVIKKKEKITAKVNLFIFFTKFFVYILL
ncbi:hypothetical protein ES705_28720 [subsurface metagenome]